MDSYLRRSARAGGAVGTYGRRLCGRPHRTDRCAIGGDGNGRRNIKARAGLIDQRARRTVGGRMRFGLQICGTRFVMIAMVLMLVMVQPVQWHDEQLRGDSQRANRGAGGGSRQRVGKSRHVHDKGPAVCNDILLSNKARPVNIIEVWHRASRPSLPQRTAIRRCAGEQANAIRACRTWMEPWRIFRRSVSDLCGVTFYKPFCDM